MRANEFIYEAAFGITPKRNPRDGSRPPRGHVATKQINVDEEFEMDEAGKAPRKLCISKKSDKDLGASQLSSCKAQGLRKRDTSRKFRIGKDIEKIKGKLVKSSDYGGPLPKWKGN